LAREGYSGGGKFLASEEEIKNIQKKAIEGCGEELKTTDHKIDRAKMDEAPQPT